MLESVLKTILISITHREINLIYLVTNHKYLMIIMPKYEGNYQICWLELCVFMSAFLTKTLVVIYKIYLLSIMVIEDHLIRLKSQTLVSSLKQQYHLMSNLENCLQFNHLLPYFSTNILMDLKNKLNLQTLQCRGSRNEMVNASQ